MKVNIIGAGISGLYTAYLLSKSGVEVEIFEASKRSGGRILSLAYENNKHVELGAEVIYDTNGLLVKTINTLNDPICELCGDNYYYYQQQIKPFSQWKDNAAITQLLDDIYEIEDYEGEETSLLNHFQQKSYYNSDMINLVEAFACEYGTNADQLGVRNLVLEENAWSGGDEEYYFHSRMQNVADYYKNFVSERIQYAKIIKHISYGDSSVSITDQNNEQHISDKVIVSVNLGILKAGDIGFSPALPEAKRNAIQSIGIDQGIKVILIFSQQWWPDDLLTIEGGSSCHEFLATKVYKLPTLTGFVMGRRAKQCKNMDNKQLGEMLCNELDTLFGHKHASNTLESVFHKNWGEDIFQKGAYSFPTKNSNGMREVLAQTVDNKLYFMGEACNTNGHAASIHGAMETAEEVYQEIMSELARNE